MGMESPDNRLVRRLMAPAERLVRAGGGAFAGNPPLAGFFVTPCLGRAAVEKENG
jgi:hypothetical protein